jgi:hypothetical protein
MNYVILDSTGNLVASFDDEAVAMAAMGQIGYQDPLAVGELALIKYDDAGMPVGDSVILSEEHLVTRHAVISFADETREGQNAYFPIGAPAVTTP